MSRRIQAFGLGLSLCFCTSMALAGNCATRDAVVRNLQTKYDEQLAVGGLQATQNTTSVMEIWASRKTGTFTVLMTNPNGVTCIVAAGTDFFEAEKKPAEVPGTPS